MEAAAAVEIAVLAGDTDPRSFDACLPIASRLVALLTGLLLSSGRLRRPRAYAKDARVWDNHCANSASSTSLSTC